MTTCLSRVVLITGLAAATLGLAGCAVYSPAPVAPYPGYGYVYAPAATYPVYPAPPVVVAPSWGYGWGYGWGHGWGHGWGYGGHWR
ncbi:MAG: hypothetical protein F8N37_03720 [Telmatospirillum sp.]|nr:hypothetical protein [Telmatospirillum sp.]